VLLRASDADEVAATFGVSRAWIGVPTPGFESATILRNRQTSSCMTRAACGKPHSFSPTIPRTQCGEGLTSV